MPAVPFPLRRSQISACTPSFQAFNPKLAFPIAFPKNSRVRVSTTLLRYQLSPIPNMTPTPPSRFSPNSFRFSRPARPHRPASRSAIPSYHGAQHAHHTYAGPPQTPVTPLADETAVEGIDEDVSSIDSQGSEDEDQEQREVDSDDDDVDEDADRDVEIDEEGLPDDGEEEGGIEEGEFEFILLQLLCEIPAAEGRRDQRKTTWCMCSSQQPIAAKTYPTSLLYTTKCHLVALYPIPEAAEKTPSHSSLPLFAQPIKLHPKHKLTEQFRSNTNTPSTLRPSG